MYGGPAAETPDLLYVGKAAGLRDRVGSYFQSGPMAPKVDALVQADPPCRGHRHRFGTEALLLEYNLIKEHRPRFNVILRDDKSFPVHTAAGA